MKSFLRKLHRRSYLPIFIKRFLLWLALGSTYNYMQRTLAFDRRLPHCKLADIIVRQDGKEIRIEADWLKTLCKIIVKQSKHISPPRAKKNISSHYHNNEPDPNNGL